MEWIGACSALYDEVIIWSNYGLVYRCIYASLGLDELNMYIYDWLVLTPWTLGKETITLVHSNLTWVQVILQYHQS